MDDVTRASRLRELALELARETRWKFARARLHRGGEERRVGLKRTGHGEHAKRQVASICITWRTTKHTRGYRLIATGVGKGGARVAALVVGVTRFAFPLTLKFRIEQLRRTVESVSPVGVAAFPRESTPVSPLPTCLLARPHFSPITLQGSRNYRASDHLANRVP